MGGRTTGWTRFFRLHYWVEPEENSGTIHHGAASQLDGGYDGLPRSSLTTIIRSTFHVECLRDEVEFEPEPRFLIFNQGLCICGRRVLVNGNSNGVRSRLNRIFNHRSVVS